MANLALWNLVSELKSEKYKWVDLTHELSPETPHWYGFNPLEAKLLFDYVEGTPGYDGSHALFPSQRGQPVWHPCGCSPSLLGRRPFHGIH